MKYLQVLLITILFYSCIPLKIAPKIEDYSLVKAKRIKKKLPNQNAFVFNDPKNADEFYQYIDAKLGFEELEIKRNIPFKIKGKEYFFSYYEAERTTKTLNLLPILIDLKTKTPVLENLYTSRKGNWYIVITVTDMDINDCLNPNYKHQRKVVSYLKKLKEEYLKTSNYKEILLKR